MQIIIVTANIQISLRVLSVESQASYRADEDLAHHLALSINRCTLCDDRHKLIIDCSNRKPLDLRTIAPVNIDNLIITGRMVWIEFGCLCTGKMTLANGAD